MCVRHLRKGTRGQMDFTVAPAVLPEYAGERRTLQDNWPKIQCHARREHAALVFQKQLEG